MTRGFVWLDQKPNNTKDWSSSSSTPYQVSENTSRFKEGSSKPSIRISRIIVESFRLGLKHVRWFVMGDDDTVFFADNLVTLLSNYDHNQMYYIGGNSESVEQNVMHSYEMAFGGGGFAISYGLAVQLNKVLDDCIDRYWYMYGSDERIDSCLNELGVPLTRHLGFHQFDIRGNPYGLLAAHPIAPLISLHHLDAVTPLFPNNTRLDSLKLLLGAYQVDPGRILQHSFCHDLERNWSISVSWGYSVQIYPSLLNAKVLGAALLTFKTWRSWNDAPFSFDTRMISSDPCERPILYFLDRVDELGNGETLTSYKRFVGETGMDCDNAALAVHRITVSATRMEPDEWKKAPRRQCCEIVNRENGVKTVIHVRMRKCKPSESVGALTSKRTRIARYRR
ncbi:glycosyltransferase [Thalictrum thalictroides]|uniref:Glycosyltransferase n=1 Tax=Thalictrum thalictroides TaxID=46969 RepID=A0A7J6V3M7_THATH|nr:glycosyltransferase [Thalictrum thalictroides]